MIQWTGSSRQEVSIPWTRIDSFAAIDSLADRVAEAPRIWRNYSTAIGEALAFSLRAFDEAGHCTRHLIDLSGDGPSNEGIEPNTLHEQLRQAGVTVNAIAIEESEPELTAYFFENVIVGEGAFVETASGFADYPARIRRKLLREVTRQSAEFDPVLSPKDKLSPFLVNQQKCVITGTQAVITSPPVCDEPRQKTAP